MADKKDQKSKLEIEGYVYCSEHDIFYNEALVREDEKEAKAHFDISVISPSCPLCKTEIIMSVMSCAGRCCD